MPVQSADQHDSGSYALLSLPHQQPRPVYPSSQDAIMDQIGETIDMRPHEGPHIEVEWEPLVLAHVSLTPDPPSYPLGLMRRWRSRPSPPALPTAINEDECIEEAGRIRQTTLSITNLRQRNIDDKAAGQRHGDLGVYVGGSRLPVGNHGRGHGRPSYRRPPTPTASSPSRRVPLLRTGPHQALVGSDAAATATTALEAKTPPALASPVIINRSELSTESGRRRQSTAPS